MDDDRRRGDWIQTFTGRQFWPMDPQPEDVDIRDIARALSNLCRFGGHVSAFYSVAQHSVYVSAACDPADALWGLLHDAAEAYCVDLPRPLKHLPELAPYREAEAGVMRAVCERFGLSHDMPRSVHAADNSLLGAEAKRLKHPVHPKWSKWLVGAKPWPFEIHPLGPEEAERAFLVRYDDLRNRAVA